MNPLSRMLQELYHCDRLPQPRSILSDLWCFPIPSVWHLPPLPAVLGQVHSMFGVMEEKRATDVKLATCASCSTIIERGVVSIDSYWLAKPSPTVEWVAQHSSFYCNAVKPLKLL